MFLKIVVLVLAMNVSTLPCQSATGPQDEMDGSGIGVFIPDSHIVAGAPVFDAIPEDYFVVFFVPPAPTTEPTTNENLAAVIETITMTTLELHETVGSSIFVSEAKAPFDQNNSMASITRKAFCGYPPYSDRQACITQNYFKDHLSKCDIEGGIILFGCGIILLGILIISANVLLPLVVWKNPEMRTQYGFIKAAFSKYFEYKLQPALLIHMMTLKEHPADKNGEKYLGYQGPLYMIFSFILPYIITVIFCILTGVVGCKKLNSRIRKHYGDNGHNILGKGKQNSKKILRPEISIFITIITMVSAFTVTLLPFTIVMILFVVGQLNCSNYKMPYAITFYAGLLNSLANPFIYAVRENKFQSAVRGIFSPMKAKSKHPAKTAPN